MSEQIESAALALREICATLPLIQAEPLLYEDIDTRLAALGEIIPALVTAPRLLAADYFLQYDQQQRLQGTPITVTPAHQALYARAESFFDSVFEVTTSTVIQRWQQREEGSWHRAMTDAMWRELYRRCLFAPDNNQLYQHYEIMKHYFNDTRLSLLHFDKLRRQLSEQANLTA